MKLKVALTITILIILNIQVYPQRYQIRSILNKIWELENEKFEGYKTYLFCHNNLVFRFELKNGELFHSENYFICKYQLLSDSTLNLFSEEITDKELTSFFNKGENKKLLLDDYFIDFSRGIKCANVIHLYENNGVVNDAHIWVYQFYNKNNFNQYGFSETPGQPQVGYIYNLATNVPKEVMKEVRKINAKNFIAIKVNKSQIYKTLQLKTKMYLIEGDIIERLEVKNDWIKIRYYGKKTIEGWIKKSDVE